MIVTVWRHAEAGIAASDAFRPITPKGREALQVSGSHFVRELEKASIGSVTSLLYSPYLRTRESAEILRALCHPAQALAENRLAPGSDFDDIAQLVVTEERHLLLVSHHPLVSALVSFWCDDPTLAPLSPGGFATVALLCSERGGAELMQYRPEAVWSAA